MSIMKQPETGTEAEGLRGGKGKARLFRVALDAEKMGPTGMAARIELEPGTSIGYHLHEDDEETYAIVSGEGVFTGDGKDVSALPGDIFVTCKGHGHGLRNTGEEPLVFFAVIARGETSA